MEPFRFSHYPMSTRRQGKRNLEAEYEHDNHHDGSISYDGAPLAKRLKTANDEDDEEGKSTGKHHSSTILAITDGQKRDFAQAFCQSPSPANEHHHDDISVPSPPSQRARVLLSQQSAGQITTESPESSSSRVVMRQYDDHHNHHQERGSSSSMMMNGFLGQLHAERQQRLQHAATTSHSATPPCPLTMGMHAMTIQQSSVLLSSSQPQARRNATSVQLKTDSKLA